MMADEYRQVPELPKETPDGNGQIRVVALLSARQVQILWSLANVYGAPDSPMVDSCLEWDDDGATPGAPYTRDEVAGAGTALLDALQQGIEGHND